MKTAATIKQIATKELAVHNGHRKYFSAIDETELARLITDIKERGIQTPLIVTADNKVVCGRMRLAAAKKCNIETVPCIVKTYADDSELLIDLVSDNVMRRQLGKQELASLAAKLESDFRAATKQSKAAPKNGVKYEKPELTVDKRGKPVKEHARAKAARALGTSEGSLATAKTISKFPKPIIEAVDAKELATTLALKLGDYPKAVVNEIAAAIDSSKKGDDINAIVKDILKRVDKPAPKTGTALAVAKKMTGTFIDSAAIINTIIAPEWGTLPKETRTVFVSRFRELQAVIKPMIEANKKDANADASEGEPNA